jgi:predicted phage terminase large subunit-like protein
MGQAALDLDQNSIVKILAENARQDLSEFVREFWGVVVPDDELIWNWHLDVLCEQLEIIARRVGQRLPKEYDLIVNIPPGTTKSLLCCVMFPVWCWTNWHWIRFIAASYSAGLALEHAELSRDLVRSQKFQEYYPELRVKRDKDVKSNFKLEKVLENGEVVPGGNRYSTSVGGTLTGFHAHILIWDDPLDPRGARSTDIIEGANKWIDETLPTRKTDKRRTPTIGIMQRLAQNDPTGHLLAKEKENLKLISLPGEILDPRYEEQVKPKKYISYYKNGLLDPVRMPLSVLKEMEQDLGQYGYAGQVGQLPVPPGGGMFKTDKIAVVDKLPPGEIQMSIRYWDKAGTKAKDNPDAAFTAGLKMHRMVYEGVMKFVIEDVKRGQWDSAERETIIKSITEADGKAVRVGIEQEPGSGGKESAENTVRNLAGFRVFVDRPTGDKADRADPFSVQVNYGNVIMVRGDWNNKFIDELKHFPHSKTKDQVDAASGAFNKMVKRKKKGGRVT